MDDPDPIKQLQHLLEDPGKLLEKISRIQSVLGSTHESEPRAAETSPPPVAAPSTDPLPARDRRYHRALQILQEMQAQLNERLLPLAQAAAQAESELLRERALQDQAQAQQCLAQIDRVIANCAARLHEARDSYAELATLNRKLQSLGAEPEPLAEIQISEDIAEIIQNRLAASRRDHSD